MKILHDMFTGVDNQTYDLGRVLIALTTLSYFSLSYMALPHFNPLEWSGGAMAILTGGGIFLKVKETTEPKK